MENEKTKSEVMIFLHKESLSGFPNTMGRVEGRVWIEKMMLQWQWCIFINASRGKKEAQWSLISHYSHLPKSPNMLNLCWNTALAEWNPTSAAGLLPRSQGAHLRKLLGFHFQETKVYSFIRNKTSPNNESHHNQLYWPYCLFMVTELHTTHNKLVFYAMVIYDFSP